MVFWIVAGGVSITLAVTIWVAVQRARSAQAKPTAAYDLEIYRDQLKELERDVARGIIGTEEADRAKLEISRRILEADKAVQTENIGSAGRDLPVAIALLGTVAGAVLVYMNIGAPGYPDQPRDLRITEIESARASRPTQSEAEENTAGFFESAEPSAEQAADLTILRNAAEQPDGGFEVLLDLARAEAGLRNYIAAREAQERAIGLMGPRADASAWVDLARLRILAAAGYVSPEAEEALRQALAIDPAQGDARFLLGVMYERQERPDAAFEIWSDLLADSTGSEPWVGPILQQIEQVASFAGQQFDPGSLAPALGAGAAPGPSQAQIDAAAEMTPEERMEMIRGMVASLNERLATDGGTAEDWARLIGAYGVLGEITSAEAILAEARQVFADDAAAQALFDEVDATLPRP